MDIEKYREDTLVSDRQNKLKQSVYVEDDNLNLSQPYIIDNGTQKQHYQLTTQQPSQPLPTQQPIYRTSINQLISQPAHDNIYSMQNIYQSLYQLSDYLWNKKLYHKYGSGREGENSMGENIMQVSFDQYLLPIQEELLTYQRFRRSRERESERVEGVVNVKASSIVNNTNISSISNSNNPPLTSTTLQTQLIKCYQQVPFIYFQQHFTLDFGNFHTLNTNFKFTNTQQMREQQQKMNDQLDLIEINLFGQIHRKFQDYFKAAANFDYLQESICVQLKRLAEARARVNKVKVEFVEKSQRLRRKIIERNNYQKTLKKLKLMRSLRKLPQIIQTILSSSLPYQCLQLLTTTRSSISQVHQITSISSTIQNIKSSQTLVQLGLSKRYTDQLYLYVEQQVFTRIDFYEQLKRISRQCRVIEDKQGNSSSLSGVLNMSGCSSGGNVRRVAEQMSNNSIVGSSNRQKGGNNDRSMYIDEDHPIYQSSKHQQQQYLLKNVYAKRQQAKEYEIAMILLQSYQYLDFPVEVTKIKLANGLRVVAKRFEKDLVKHVKGEIAKSDNNKSSDNNNNSQHNRTNSLGIIPFMSSEPLTTTTTITDQQQSPQHIRQLLDRVSIHSYTRQIQTINQLFKQSINRYLGYVLTLVTEYEQKVHKEIVLIIEKSGKGKLATSVGQMLVVDGDGNNNGVVGDNNSQRCEINTPTTAKPLVQQQKSLQLAKLQQSHTKFKSLFSQQLNILPSIFKIIQQKIKYFLTLKNMSNASPQQFYQWVGLVRYWQRWFDCFIQQSVLVNYTCTYFNAQQINHTNIQPTTTTTQLLSLGQDMISQLITIIVQNIKKSLFTMSIKPLITQLTLSYINSYASIIKGQLNQAILEESWQSVEIPQEFSEILLNILVRGNTGDGHNLSLTILNSSTTQMSTSFHNDSNIISNTLSSTTRFKFKILKNNILLQGQRYKLTVSFLLLCQFIQQLIKLSRLFQTITGQTDQQSIKQSKHIKFILSNIYQKIYQLIDAYNSTTKEMILEKKALKMERIKGNNIAVKHICLLSNCLTFLSKLTEHIPQQELSTIINKKEQQAQTLSALANHNTLLIDKISSILNKKMEQIILSFRNKEQQKSFSLVSLLQFVTQSNQSIVTLFLQITQIIDEYLDVDKCERILKQPFQLFVQKYFKFIILKGDKIAQQARLLLQKMKFLKKYFKNQFVMMQREVEE